MTIETIQYFKRVNGDDVTDEISVSMRVLATSDLRVSLIPDGTNVPDLQVEGTDYDVAINVDSEGAVITFGTPPPSTHDVLIENLLELTQTAMLPTEGDFNEVDIETALDRARLIDIQQQNQIDRSAKLHPEDPLNVEGWEGLFIESVVDPDDRDDMIIAWNEEGDALTSSGITVTELQDLIDSGGLGGVGPQGPKGDKGDKGDTGATGAAGNGSGDVVAANYGSEYAGNTALFRSNLGIDLTNITITGGTITGITDITVADGGTGRSALTAHYVLVGNGTSPVGLIDPSTSGYVLTSNGAGSDPTFQAPAGVTTGSIRQSVYSEYTTYAAVGTIPFDNTIPQKTEGTEITTVSITPSDVAHTVRVRASVEAGAGAGTSKDGIIIAALFINTTANAIAVASQFLPSTGNAAMVNLDFEIDHAPGSTSAQTYKLRVGYAELGTGPGTFVGAVNGTNGARKFGGASRCTLTAEEIIA